MLEEKIILNAAKCTLCKEIIISKHVHDLKRCSCGNIFVDGGNDYLKRGYNDIDTIEELSLVEINNKIYSVIDKP